MTYDLTNIENARARLIRAAVILALGTLVALASTHSANAHPTFSCKKTYSKTERAICKNTELGKLDQWMAKEYKFLRRSMNRNDRRSLRNDQRNWLRVRNRCASRTNCIMDQYYLRISELVEWNMP